MATDKEIEAAAAAISELSYEYLDPPQRIKMAHAALTAAEQVRASERPKINASDVDPTAGLDPDFNWGGDP